MGKAMVSGTYILGTRHVAGIEIQDPGSEAAACFHVTKDLNSWIRGKTSNLWHRSLRSLTLLETSFPKCLGMCGLSSQRELCIPSTRRLEFEISTPQKAEGWDPSTFSAGKVPGGTAKVRAPAIPFTESGSCEPQLPSWKSPSGVGSPWSLSSPCSSANQISLVMGIIPQKCQKVDLFPVGDWNHQPAAMKATDFELVVTVQVPVIFIIRETRIIIAL
jgi:hypothetical protein